MRNKDNHPRDFDGPKHFENPRAKTEYASLKPNGQIAMRPRERMRKSSVNDATPDV